MDQQGLLVHALIMHSHAFRDRTGTAYGHRGTAANFLFESATDNEVQESLWLITTEVYMHKWAEGFAHTSSSLN